jgi:excisionase family DNA binding protein
MAKDILMSNQGMTINLTSTIPDALTDVIADKVFEKLKPLLLANVKRENNAIFDVDGLASYLNVSKEWIRDKARIGEIPCFKSGKYWKFRQRDIDKHFQSRCGITYLSGLRSKQSLRG